MVRAKLRFIGNSSKKKIFLSFKLDLFYFDWVMFLKQVESILIRVYLREIDFMNELKKHWISDEIGFE